mgnify:FL=1
MSQDCLLLNGNGKPVSYFPLSVLNWKTAVKLTLTRNVILIKEHHDRVVRSPNFEMKVPSILMLPRFHKFHNYVKFSRSNVLLRDMYTCQYCSEIFDKKDLTLDHVIPKSKKGPSNWENVVTACKSCNLKKGDKPGKPIKEPIKPSFSHLLNGHKFEKDAFPDKDWAKYIFSS